MKVFAAILILSLASATVARAGWPEESGRGWPESAGAEKVKVEVTRNFNLQAAETLSESTGRRARPSSDRSVFFSGEDGDATVHCRVDYPASTPSGVLSLIEKETFIAEVKRQNSYYSQAHYMNILFDENSKIRSIFCSDETKPVSLEEAMKVMDGIFTIRK